jgi:hypothetical protein
MRAFEILNEDPAIKSRVLAKLSKTPDDSPIFPQVYKTLVGEPLTGRIRNYIKARGDNDASSAIDHLDKLIPTLGDVNEVKAFMAKFTKKRPEDQAYDFIKIDRAFPKDGMPKALPLSSVVDDGFAKKLFDSLVDGYKGKNDAGPGEAALAIMSPNITYAQGSTIDEFGRGGDIIVNGVGKVEVKGGTGGRLVAATEIDQKGMTIALAGYQLTKPAPKRPKKSVDAVQQQQPALLAGITPGTLSKPLPDGFPAEAFIRAACQAWFGEEKPELVKAVGTSQFRRIWVRTVYNAYRTFAGFSGILFINKNAYQYTVSGDQIPDASFKDWGYIYYPKVAQIRNMFPQVLPIA